MKRSISIIFLTCNLLLLLSCKQSKYQKETSEFSQFLHKNFGLKLPKNKSVYILLPSCQCKNCIYLNGATLSDYVNQRLFIISSIDTVNYKHFKNVIFDQEDRVIKLSFLDYANKMVLVEDGQIQHIIKMKDFNNQMDSIQHSFFDTSNLTR